MKSRFFPAAALSASIAIGLLYSGQAFGQAGGSAQRAAPTAGQAGEMALFAGIFEGKTGMKPDAVAPAPLPGFLEIVVGSNIYYMEPTGKWLFDGHLVDLDTKTSVTAIKKQELASKAVSPLRLADVDLKDAITTYDGGNAARTIVVFSDPSCPFCRRLEDELKKLKSVTVHMLPISFLGPRSQELNETIWCSKDRTKAWLNALSGAELAKPGACNAGAIARNTDLARSLGVSGTPTIYFADGSHIPGAVPAQKIEDKLKSIEAKVRTAR